MGDDPVDAIGREQGLAERGNVHIGLHGCVQGIDADLRRRCGVRFLAVKPDLEVFDREESRVDVIARRRVDHHRRGHPGEGAGVDQIDLAAEVLLGGRPQHANRDAQFFCQGSQRCPGTTGCGGDDVVAAGVPDLGQRVVLGADHNFGPTVAHPGVEAGRQIPCRVFHLEAFAFEKIGEQA